METKKRFEGYDLIKLCLLFVILLIPVILYAREVNQAQANRGVIVIAVDDEAGSKEIGQDGQPINPEDGQPGSGETNGDQPDEPVTSDSSQDGTGSFGDRNGVEEPSAGAGEPSEPGSPAVSLEDLPPPPPSSEPLVLSEDKQSLSTTTGIKVYTLDVTRLVWVPVVPEDVTGVSGGAEPFLDGRNVWVILNPEMQVLFQWDPGLLVWNPGDGSMVVMPVPTEPAGETGGTAGETGGETGGTTTGGETGGTTTGGETGGTTTGGETGGTTTGGETGGTTTGGETGGTTTGGETGGTTTGGETGGTTTGGETGGTTTGGETGGTTTGGETGGTTTGETGGTTTDPTVPVVVIPEELLVVPNVYGVRTGEHTFCVARRFNINPYDLMTANNLTPYTWLKAGMALTIPKNARPFPSALTLIPHPVMHVVQKGETVGLIACMYGDVFPEAIIYANNLVAPFRLTPGQEILIP